MMFDADGVVAKRLAVGTAPLPAGKTSLKVFDIEDLLCERVGRVLLNDALACADASGPRDDCLGLVVPVARGAVDFLEYITPPRLWRIDADERGDGHWQGIDPRPNA